MTKFTYIGGKEFDGAEMPGSVTMFDVRFPMNVPVDVASPHAIKKLTGNRFFERWAEDAVYEDVPAEPKRRGRQAKPKVEAAEVPHVERVDE